MRSANMRDASFYLERAREAEAEAAQVQMPGNRDRWLELAGIWRRLADELAGAPAHQAA